MLSSINKDTSLEYKGSIKQNQEVGNLKVRMSSLEDTHLTIVDMLTKMERNFKLQIKEMSYSQEEIKKKLKGLSSKITFKQKKELYEKRANRCCVRGIYDLFLEEWAPCKYSRKVNEFWGSYQQTLKMVSQFHPSYFLFPEGLANDSNSAAGHDSVFTLGMESENEEIVVKVEKGIENLDKKV